MRWLEAAIAGFLMGFPLALLAVAIAVGARRDGSVRRPRPVELATGAWGMAGAIVAHGLSNTTGLGPLANGVAVVPAAFGAAYVLHLVVVGRSTIVGDPVRPVVASVLVLLAAAAFFEVARGLEPIGGPAGQRVIELWNGPEVVVELIIAAAVALAGVAATAVVVTSTPLALRARVARASRELLAQGGHDPRAVAATMAAISAAAGALAGIALARGQQVAPPNVVEGTVLGAEVAIVGGLGSLPGAVVAGVVLGLLRALGDEVSAGWGPVLGHLLAIGVLAVRAIGDSLAQPRLEGPAA